MRVSYAAGFAVIALLVIAAAAFFALTAVDASPVEMPKET
jgi:hypothetical protein